MGTQYTICCWAINRSDPQNLLSVTLDVPLHPGYQRMECKGILVYIIDYSLWEPHLIL